MDQVLGQILRQAVWERLDMLDELANSADNGSLLSVARSELPRLAHGWRALLASHAPDSRGRCPECSGHWRSRAASCSVWQAAHEHLVSAESVPSQAVSAESTASESIFSRLRADRSGWQVRQPAAMFPTAAAAAR
ncbi:MAG TPA: hypothetical protein VE673_09335 [Pseudonocardiaceae bacterium]|nr:hypothetical protein [Pseudonocardiaceae bacterium]